MFFTKDDCIFDNYNSKTTSIIISFSPKLKFFPRTFHLDTNHINYNGYKFTLKYTIVVFNVDIFTAS